MSDVPKPISIERTAELFAWMARHHDIADERLDRVLEILLDRFRSDRMSYSDIFEPSFSRLAGRFHFYRFSYAFPGFKSDPDGTLDTLRNLCKPFGERLVDYVDNLSQTMTHPCVSQPLFGLAYDGPEDFRVKLYIQFGQSGTASAVQQKTRQAALKVAESATGCLVLSDTFHDRNLHLLGLDLGSTGLRQAKLYFLHSPIELSEITSILGELELIEHLGSLGKTELRDFLIIHRMQSPTDMDLTIPAEIDFSLGANQLAWEQLTRSETLKRATSEDAYQQLTTSFQLAFRRISVSIFGADKLNAYYVLNESE
jgi:hypothetical protein